MNQLLRYYFEWDSSRIPHPFLSNWLEKFAMPRIMTARQQKEEMYTFYPDDVVDGGIYGRGQKAYPILSLMFDP